MGTNARHPHPRHYKAVWEELRRHMAQNGEVNMDSLAGYCELLNKYGDKAMVVVLSAEDMFSTRVKSAKHILNQPSKDGFISSTDTFNMDVLDTSEI